MSGQAVDVQSFISKKLHSLLYIEEFVFSRNKFSPPLSSELELADEVVRYFRYREMVLTCFADTCVDLPEPAIAGHFVGGNPDVPPTIESAMHLHRLVRDEAEWDLAPLMRGMHDHFSAPGISDDY